MAPTTLPREVRRRAQAIARLQARTVNHPSAIGEAIARLLGPADARLSSDEQASLWRYRARGADPLAVFVSLFVLGETLPRSVLSTAFGDDFAPALACGVFAAAASKRAVKADLSLSIHDGRCRWSDPDRDHPPVDHVLGATRATLVLERALPPAPLGSALEIGTGAGHIAITLADRARHVTATDVSPHALALAGLNAALAGVRNVTLLRSDRFAAIGRRRFDFITGNLPFVIAPSRQYVFRDGGMAEDGFVASVVAGAGKHLLPGAFALFLGQWIHREDEAEDERLAPWFVAAGCDALVLRLDADPAETYAARWSAGPARDLSRSQRDRELEEWIHHLRRGRIRGVSTGLFVLRRRPGPRHFLSIDECDGPDHAGSVLGSARSTPTWEEITARYADLDRHAGVALQEPKTRRKTIRLTRS